MSGSESGVMLGLVQTMAVGSSLLLALAPFPEVKELAVRKSTENRSFWPYFAMWQCALLWILYGWLTGQMWPVAYTNSFTCAMSSYYCSAYFQVTSSSMLKRQIRAAFMLSSLLTGSLAVYCNTYQWLQLDQEVVAQQVGCIGSAASVAMYATPLTTITEVVKKKSASSLSLNLAVGGNLSAALWCVYGYMVDDAFLERTNLVGGVCCMVQLLLFYIFPDNTSKHFSKSNI